MAGHPPDLTTVFSQNAPPVPLGAKSPDMYRVNYQGSGVIDASNSYSRSSAATPVVYTVTRQPNGEQLISNISQKGLFVVADGLSDLRRPVHVYFPSHRSNSNGSIPRLVPDTVFLPVQSKQGNGLGATDVLSQLLSGPTDWTEPGVYVTTQVGTPITLISVQPVPATGLTIVNLSDNAAQIRASYLATLKAQIAYTLADLGTRGPIQLDANGVHLGDEYSLSKLDPGYNPDGHSASSPLYYISHEDTLVARTKASASVGFAGSSPVPDKNVTVLAHVNGVRQIAVAGPSGQPGVGSQAVVGVRVKGGTASLEMGVLGDQSANPWTTVPVPGARKLSTPSFDPDGQAVWTVATTAAGTQLYRVSLGGATLGNVEAIKVTDDQGGVVRRVTGFRISTDGTRAAVIAAGQTFAGIVYQHSSPKLTTDGQVASVFSVVGLRPVISVAAKTPDVEVYWADRFNLGVVVHDERPNQPTDTPLFTVSADGYTVGPDGFGVDSIPVASAPTDAVQFAHAPNHLWVASVRGDMTRQPAPDPLASNESGVDTRDWDELGSGSWPTYSG